MTQPSRLDNRQTRLLLAVAQQEFPTVRSVADAAGESVGVAYDGLLLLREQGFVAWTPGARGTLRALYKPMAVAA